MNDDLVARLREQAKAPTYAFQHRDAQNVCREAADEIVRLRAGSERIANLAKAATERFKRAEAERDALFKCNKQDESERQGLLVLLKQREDELAEETAIRERLAQLCAGAIVAIRGPEPKLTRWGYHDLPERVAAIVAERDALRRDAERYRWLRMKEVRVHQDREPYGCIMAASELALDDGIDRALREGK